VRHAQQFRRLGDAKGAAVADELQEPKRVVHRGRGAGPGGSASSAADLDSFDMGEL
jgi:hypothetical protein